jgi:threonine dehydrogenase-like Zn-dependent dehydrogenase
MTPTLALRIHGKNDLRLDSFDLPPIKENEILAEVVSNSICMSTHKLAIQGQDHKRVRCDLSRTPTIVGHEFCGRILEVGKDYRKKFAIGSKYTIQPAINYPGRELEAPGYSFAYTGGHATKVIIPAEVLEMDCLLPYDGPGFFPASLSEPVSCIVGAFKTQYHFRPGSYEHVQGIVEGGTTAILAGAGPMGLGAIDYALHGPRKPRLLVMTDIDQERLDRTASIFTPKHAAACGVDLKYVNTHSGPERKILDLTGGSGYDDVFVFAPIPALVEQASRIMGHNGCLNFFAGPPTREFTAAVNFYDIHYSGHHVVGSSGGNTDDMREALALMAQGTIDPAVMITHIGGLDSAAQTIMELPAIPGGKKLIYTQISLPLTAIDHFADKGRKNPLFATLAEITARHKGLRSVEAEEYLLEYGKRIA